MRRRTYLGVLGASLFAGCTGSEPSGAGDGQTGVTVTPADAKATPRPTEHPTAADPTDSPTSPATDSPTPTATPTHSVALEIGSPSLISIDRGYTVVPGGEVSVTNTGNAPTEAIRLAFDWFDTGGTYLVSDTAHCLTLGAGETWVGRIPAISVGTDVEVGSVEVSLSDDVRPATLSAEGVELGETQLRASSENAVVRGTATNTRSQPIRYIEAIAKFYDAQGTVLATAYTNESEFAAGADWRFELRPFMYGRESEVDSVAVVLTTDSVMF